MKIGFIGFGSMGRAIAEGPVSYTHLLGDGIEQRPHRVHGAALEAVLRGEIVGIIVQQHRPVEIPFALPENDVDRGLQRTVGDADAVRVLLDRHVRHAAEHIARLILMREKVSEGPEDRHGAPVLCGDCGERLDEMRMPADDEIGPVVGQKRCV